MNNKFDLSGRVAIITGGGTGVGAATARLMASFGADVVLVGRTEENLIRVADEINAQEKGRAYPMKTDIQDEEQVVALVEQVHGQFSKIDMLINNAGGGRALMLEETSLSGWHKVMSKNLDGTFLCTREVGKHMIAKNAGAIVNVSTMAAIVGAKGQSAYAAAKAGVQALTRIAANEWGQYGIRVNCVALGFIAHERSAWDDAVVKEALSRLAPLGRHGLADEVAHAIMFFASDASSYITGQTVEVAGGLNSLDAVADIIIREKAGTK